jgi:Family of unknown function (DUF5682)
MTELRTAVETQYPPDLENPKDRREALREAHMRQTIRLAQKDGFTKIAIICGAWHTPALMPPLAPAKADAALLKGLPKAKVSATWVPWTYERLTFQSGYGAGVESPGWYEHLWQVNDRPSERWLVKIARLLRTKDLDASSASVIETVRMAEALAALRRLQQRLRLKPEALDKELVLDLRKEMDLGRSQLLHRLTLLNIPWGDAKEISGKGTFKEKWMLSWRPELEIALIEAGRWGNTVEVAATVFACDRAAHATQLPPLTALLEQVLQYFCSGAGFSACSQYQNGGV